MRRAAQYFLTACLAVAAATSCVLAADTLEQFKQAKPDIWPLLRSKEPQDRIEAIKRLQKFPVEDAVRMMHTRLDDEDPRVSKQVCDALLTMNDNHEVCETLLALAKRELHARTAAAAPPPIFPSCSPPGYKARSVTWTNCWRIPRHRNMARP